MKELGAFIPEFDSINCVSLAPVEVQICHKRKLPALVLKLDFAKAFDTVN
jgi:hypothetical protein